MKLRIQQAQKRLMKLLAKQDGELERLISQASDEASRILQAQLAAEETATISAQVRALQYQQIRSSLVNMAAELWVETIPSNITSNVLSATQLAANESKAFTQLLGARAEPGRIGLLQSSLESSAYKNFDDLASRIANDIDLSKSVYRGQAFTTGKIDDIVNQGILLGKSAREIATDVKGFINPKTPGGVRYAAHRLGRTELNNAYHETSRRSYDEAPFVEAVRWIISGSHPRPDTCDEYAQDDPARLGQGVYKTNDVPDKPHPNCFCYIIPVTPDPDEFLRKLKRGDYNCA